MSVCHIIGAGEYTPIKMEKNEGDLVVVCDGGLRYIERYGVQPDVIVGDFDSLGYRPEGENVVVLPVQKDVTDVGAAIEIAENKGYDEYRLYACAGGRISHTFANLQNLLPLAKKGKKVYLFDQKETVTYLCDGTISFSHAKGIFSLFAIGRASSVTVTGALYPLDNAILSDEFPLGVSNEFSDVYTTISVLSGTLLVVFPNDVPLPIK